MKWALVHTAHSTVTCRSSPAPASGAAAIVLTRRAARLT